MLHPFYPILPNANWIERLVPVGIKTVQLRLKDAEPETVAEHIERSLEICAKHNCQLIINDYWQHAISLKADYIHLGQEDLASANRQAIKTAELKLGLSTHDHGELQTALDADPDYVALGPIYETTLKKMKWAPQGLDKLVEWKSRTTKPVVAIGGITVERAPAVFGTGADSIAVVTDIIANAQPERRVEQWLSIAS